MGLLLSRADDMTLLMGLAACALVGLALLARARSAPLLLAALAAGAGSIAAFFVTLSIDRFAIFEEAYILGACAGAPGALLAAGLWWARRQGIGWGPQLGLGLWAAAVGGAHLWLIAIASASV